MKPAVAVDGDVSRQAARRFRRKRTVAEAPDPAGLFDDEDFAVRLEGETSRKFQIAREVSTLRAGAEAYCATAGPDPKAIERKMAAMAERVPDFMRSLMV